MTLAAANKSTTRRRKDIDGRKCVAIINLVKTSKSKLNAAALYSGDNGRLFCGELKCAGTSSFLTGRDVSGQRVFKLNAEYYREAAAIGFKPKCECCGKQGSP